MIILSAAAAITASFGWATGIVLAQYPARMLGAFEFTRIQLIACGFIMGVLTTVMGYWESVTWSYWLAFVSSIVFGIILGNLAMIECLRRGGPRRTEILLSLKAPFVAGMAFIWLGETLSFLDLVGGLIVLFGIGLAILFGNSDSTKSKEVKGSLSIIIVLGILAAFFQGMGFLIVKPAMLSGAEPMAISAIRLIGASIIISVVALWPVNIFQPHCEPTPYLLGRTILPGFIGYGVSSTLLLYAFANYNTGIVAVLGSLSPVLVIPILWVKEGKTPKLEAILGAIIATSGTAIIILN